MSIKALAKARNDLADEWNAMNPQTPEEIAEFYRTSKMMGPDLAMWHSHKLRRWWTTYLVNMVNIIQPDVFIDIGTGMGHDLQDVHFRCAPCPTLFGVEPNDAFREEIAADLGVTMFADVKDAPIEQAAMLQSIDVLEHVPNPGEWLLSIITRSPKNTAFLMTCGSDDQSTPLHLPANAGWQPHETMAADGWKLMSYDITRLMMWVKC